MNSKHQKTLKAIFSNPVNGNLEWHKIEVMLVALGAEVVEGSGSRVIFVLNDEQTGLHRPHPRKEALPYRIKQIREFLSLAGIAPPH